MLLTLVVGGRRINEGLATRALGSLAILWTRIADLPPLPDAAAADAYTLSLRTAATRLAPLASKLAARDARTALLRALSALGALLPELKAAVGMLDGMLAFASASLDEYDYDARLGSYRSLTVCALI